MNLSLPSLERLVPAGAVRDRLLVPRYPPVALEVRTDGLVAVRLQKARRRRLLAGHSLRALPEGAVGASLLQPKLCDAARLEHEVRAALEALGAKSLGKVSLALPDSLAKVTILDVPEVPAREAQAQQMIRWKLRRALPFRPEDAVLSYQLLPALSGAGSRILACLLPRDVVRQYEAVLEGLGLRVGLVDLASFNVYNALRDAVAATVPPGGDYAILNATESSFTLLIFRGESLLFYRCKTYHVGGGFQGEESLRVVQRELKTSLSYYRDKLGGKGIAHTYVRGVGLDAEQLLDLLPPAGLDPCELADAQLSVDGLDRLEPATAQVLLPALGLALGRMA